ncbi:MAG: trypsin-like serine protease [Rubrobacteraceae bacterium]
MRRASLVFAAALIAVLACGSVAGAITNGRPDGNRYPNVGGLVNDTQYSDGTWLYCSGTLISPTVFLTAAHCADDEARVRVTFDPAYEDGDKTYDGTFHGDPRYAQRQSNTHDIAVVIFDEPVTGIEPAELPTANRFNRLPKDQRFTSVGYGAYEVTNGPGGHQYLYDDVRQYATGTLNATNKTWLRISMNPSTGNGGTCYGDSGGPNFLGGTGTIAAITITGDAVCRSTNVDYRLDTESARSFLDNYDVTLP